MSPVVKQCGCGLCYTRSQWRSLPFVGHMDYKADGDQRLELRNCSCHSTVTVDLADPVFRSTSLPPSRPSYAPTSV